MADSSVQCRRWKPRKRGSLGMQQHPKHMRRMLKNSTWPVAIHHTVQEMIPSKAEKFPVWSLMTMPSLHPGGDRCPNICANETFDFFLF